MKHKKREGHLNISLSTARLSSFILFVLICLYILNSSIAQIALVRNAIIASVYEITGFIYTPLEVLIYGMDEKKEEVVDLNVQLEQLKIENYRFQELVEALKFRMPKARLLFTSYISRYNANDATELYVVHANTEKLPSAMYAISNLGVLGKCELISDELIGVRFISAYGVRTVAYIPQLKMNVIVQGEGLKNNKLIIVTPESLESVTSGLEVVTSPDSMLYMPELIIGHTEVIAGKVYVTMESKASDSRFVTLYRTSYIANNT